MFSAPEAPAPAAMQIIEAIAAQSGIVPGARIRPAHAVKTTRLITRGFISAKKSDGSARLRPDGLKAASDDTAFKSVLFDVFATNAHPSLQYAVGY